MSEYIRQNILDMPGYVPGEQLNIPELIKEYGAQFGKPELKSAFIQECAYVGADQLGILVNIKSREELIGDIIGLLQSPIRRVLSALENAKKEDAAE